MEIFLHINKKKLDFIISGVHYSLVRFLFGLKLDLGNNEMIIIPTKGEAMFFCSKLRSNLLLGNCFDVKNGQKLLNVEGCNIEIMIRNIDKQHLSGE